MPGGPSYITATHVAVGSGPAKAEGAGQAAHLWVKIVQQQLLQRSQQTPVDKPILTVSRYRNSGTAPRTAWRPLLYPCQG